MKNNIRLGLIGIILFYGFVFTVCYICGYNPFNTANFSKWDSGLYQSISESGYFIEIIEDSDALNGNAGWFPLLPFLAYISKLIFGISFQDAAFIISFVSCFALIITLLSITDEFALGGGVSKENVYSFCAHL